VNYEHRFAVAARGFLAFALIALPCSGHAATKPFDCERERCGLATDGFYPNIVVGTLAAVASRDDALRIHRATRESGWWADIPDGNEEEYLNSVAIVAIKSILSSPVTVMMTPQELAGATLNPGDLVRYTPHLPGYEKPQYNGPHAEQYYALTGCVAVLCSAGDRACFKRYRPGIYRRSDGIEVGLKSNKPLPGGARIDPQSILPIGSDRK
jgi:hypothetical protein